MNVLSLFNGMNTGRQALENEGIKVNKYYSSEIKPCAIELTQHHFADTIQLGNINNWGTWQIDYSKIDLVLSGSPCQDLSIAGKRAGLNGEKSSLFWVFVDILNHIKKLNPNVLFLQENVGSAPKKDVGIMSRALGLYPVRINSKLVTAQLRDRYYWTNIKTRKSLFDIITDIPQPKDRKIYFKDIIERGKVNKSKAVAILESESRPLNKKNQASLIKRAKKDFCNIVYEENNEIKVKINTLKGYDRLTKNDCLNLAFPTSTTRRGRITKGKSPALLEGNDPLFCLDNKRVRLLTQTELERLQGFTDGHTSILTRNKAASLLGDGWTLPVIEHIFSFIKK